MESAANIFDSLSASKPEGLNEKSRRRDDVRDSDAASQFYSLFSGNLAKSYQGSQKTANSQAEVSTSVSEAVTEVKREDVAPAEKGFLNNSNERDFKSDSEKSRYEKSSRLENDNNRSQKADSSEKQQNAEKADARSEESKADSGEKVNEKENQRKAETKVVEIRSKASKTVEGSGKTVAVETPAKVKNIAEGRKEAVRKSADVKAAQKTQQQADVKAAPNTKTAVKAADVVAEARSVKSQADVKAQPAPAAAKAESANAVQASNQSSPSQGEANTGQNANSTGVLPSSDSFAARVSKLTGKSFSQLVEEAKATQGSSSNKGAQVPPATASVHYNRRAGEVSFTTKAKGTVKTTPSQIISQIVKAAKVSINSGTQEMKILLKPEELGWMKVKISMVEGKMTAHFGVENDAVKSLLEGNLNQLQQALNGQNVKVNQIIIDVNSQSNPQSGLMNENQGNGKNKGNFMESDIEEEALEEALQGAEAQIIELSAVNVTI